MHGWALCGSIARIITQRMSTDTIRLYNVLVDQGVRLDLASNTGSVLGDLRGGVSVDDAVRIFTCRIARNTSGYG